MSAKARIIGVHPVAVSDEPVHLIEIEVDHGLDDFDFGDVTQELSDKPRGNWQVAYDEREIGKNRFAFFFHFLDIAKPLLSSAGPLELPPESPLPEHLRGLEYWPT